MLTNWVNLHWEVMLCIWLGTESNMYYKSQHQKKIHIHTVANWIDQRQLLTKSIWNCSIGKMSSPRMIPDLGSLCWPNKNGMYTSPYYEPLNYHYVIVLQRTLEAFKKYKLTQKATKFLEILKLFQIWQKLLEQKGTYGIDYQCTNIWILFFTKCKQA